MSNKLCKECKNILSTERFGKTKNTSDGYENKCRECRLNQRAVCAKQSQEKILPGSPLGKKCCRCQAIKTMDYFSRDRSRPDGFDATCKTCRSNFGTEYQKTEIYKEKSRSRSKKWREQHPGVSHEYYLKNKESYLQRSKESYNTLIGRFGKYKSSAKKMNREFSLTFEDFEMLSILPCNYCKGPINIIGIDRIDSLKGYTKANVVPSCAACNYAKLNKTPEQFFLHVREVLVFKNRDNK